MFSRDPLDIEALLSVTSLSLFLSDRVMSGHVPLSAKLMPWGHPGKSLKDKHAPTFLVPAWKRQKDSQITIPENCFLCWVQKPSASQPPPHSLKIADLGLPFLPAAERHHHSQADSPLWSWKWWQEAVRPAERSGHGRGFPEEKAF